MTPTLKVIHLVCACLFLGNVIVSGVWALLAERTRNHAIIQFSNKMVLITDAMFTLVGAVGVVWTGHGMAVNFGGGASHPWIQWSYWLLTFFGFDLAVCIGPNSIQTTRIAQAILRDHGRLLATLAHLENIGRHLYCAAFAHCLFHGQQDRLNRVKPCSCQSE